MILNSILKILEPLPDTSYEFYEKNAEKPEILLMVKCKEKFL